MDLERRLQSFVATRHGIITRAEAAELGYSTSAIDRRIEQGLWIPVSRRIYRVASVPRCYEQDVPAAAIVAKGAAGMRTAVRLHGLHGYDGRLVEKSAPSLGGRARASSSFTTLIDSRTATSSTLVRSRLPLLPGR